MRLFDGDSETRLTAPQGNNPGCHRYVDTVQYVFLGLAEDRIPARVKVSMDSLGALTESSNRITSLVFYRNTSVRPSQVKTQAHHGHEVGL
jgi:hypothetical protein